MYVSWSYRIALGWMQFLKLLLLTIANGLGGHGGANKAPPMLTREKKRRKRMSVS